MGLAAFVLIATAVHLQGITWESVDSDLINTVQNAQCLLGKDANSSTLCTYTYIVAGASMGASILLSILLVSWACTKGMRQSLRWLSRYFSTGPLLNLSPCH